MGPAREASSVALASGAEVLSEGVAAVAVAVLVGRNFSADGGVAVLVEGNVGGFGVGAGVGVHCDSDMGTGPADGLKAQTAVRFELSIASVAVSQLKNGDDSTKFARTAGPAINVVLTLTNSTPPPKSDGTRSTDTRSLAKVSRAKSTPSAVRRS
jgi:hypothetical protein